MPRAAKHLTDEERAVYQWQMWVHDFGQSGQRALKGAAVLVSRCGGVGSAAAYYLAAAGIGKLILAHGGTIKPSDLNRQILMTHDGIGRARIDSVVRRLGELNARVEVVGVGENIGPDNARGLVEQADIVIDCAPFFSERFAMNREAVRQGKPMVECAMYDMEARITTFVPGRTPCLACLYPADPPQWRREFPVLGAVAGMIGCLGAVEAIKVLSGLGQPLLGRMLTCDLRNMSFRTVTLKRNPDCPVCHAGAGT